MSAAVFQHRLAKARTAFAVAQRIDFEIQLEPEFAAHLVDHHHKLGVDCGVGAAENLDPELVKFSVASLLRALIAKHWTAIEISLFRLTSVQAGFDIRAH